MKFKTELVVALAAIFVSIATLSVYLYQARIMQKQQVTSVWPYLQWGYSYTPEGAWIQVENKGIGPAIVKEVIVKLNGNTFKSFQKLFEALGDSTAMTYTYSKIGGRVLAAGEKLQPFFIADYKKGLANFKQMKEQSFEYSICYCSVYDDCWVTTGWQVVEGECE